MSNAPEQLANLLDSVIPPHSNRNYPPLDVPSEVQIAHLMTDTTDYHLSDISQQILHDRVLTELNAQRANGRYSRIISLGGAGLRLVAGLVLISLFSLAVFASEPGQPLYSMKTLIGLDGEDNSALVTTLTVVPTETLDVTATPTTTVAPTETITMMPSSTPVPTIAVVEVEAVVMIVSATSDVSVYSEPSFTADVLTTVANNTAVIVTGYNLDGTWARVFFDAETIGWIDAGFLIDDVPTDVSTSENSQDSTSDTNANVNPPPNVNSNRPPPNNNGDNNGRPPRGGNGRGGRGGN